MKKLIILIAGIFLLIGCTTTYYTSPEYRDKKIPGKTMGIFINEYFVSNTKDVKDDLGEGDPQKVLGEFLNNVFPDYAKQFSNLKEAGIVKKTDLSDLSETKLEINSENKIYVHMPKKGLAFKTDSIFFDYVLVIDDLNINRNENQSSEFNIKVSKKGNKLISKCEYYIWDNTKNQVVSYGEQESTSSFVLAMTERTWLNLCEDMVKNILINTPFGVEIAKEF